jgi:hypothetical protein
MLTWPGGIGCGTTARLKRSPALVVSSQDFVGTAQLNKILALQENQNQQDATDRQIQDAYNVQLGNATALDAILGGRASGPLAQAAGSRAQAELTSLQSGQGLTDFSAALTQAGVYRTAADDASNTGATDEATQAQTDYDTVVTKAGRDYELAMQQVGQVSCVDCAYQRIAALLQREHCLTTLAHSRDLSGKRAHGRCACYDVLSG